MAAVFFFLVLRPAEEYVSVGFLNACTVGLQGKRKPRGLRVLQSGDLPWFSEDRILKRPSIWDVLMEMRDVKCRGQAQQCRGSLMVYNSTTF